MTLVERSMNSIDCTVVGDAMIDVTACLSDLNRLQVGGVSHIKQGKIGFGGSGNVAAGVSALGGKAAFIGKIGHDAFGQMYVDELKRRKIIAKVFTDTGVSTGLAVVFLNRERERSMLVLRGANDHLTKAEVDQSKDLFKRTKLLYFSGYSLVNDPQRESVLRAAELAKSFGSRIVFDAGAYNLIERLRKYFLRAIHLSDVFCPNLEEAVALTGNSDLEVVTHRLRELVQFTALKCGSEGCMLITRNSVLKIPAPRVNCLDTTGAGDAFAAALIFGLARRLSLMRVGELSNWFASQKVKGMGSRNYPQMKDHPSGLFKKTRAS